jgi:hypothetical protein
MLILCFCPEQYYWNLIPGYGAAFRRRLDTKLLTRNARKRCEYPDGVVLRSRLKSRRKAKHSHLGGGPGRLFFLPFCVSSHCFGIGTRPEA